MLNRFNAIDLVLFDTGFLFTLGVGQFGTLGFLGNRSAAVCAIKTIVKMHGLCSVTIGFRQECHCGPEIRIWEFEKWKR